MPGFKGQAEYSIDDKGRVALPAKMRRALAPEARDTFTATRGQERCVALFPADRWEEMETELGARNPFAKDTRDFVRLNYRFAEDVTLDGQGRIALTKALLDYAGLRPGQKALIVGTYDRIEIWVPETFEKYINEEVDDFEAITERVMGGLS